MDPAIFKSIIETGTVEGEKLTPEFALLGAFMLLIMFVMAFLSVTLDGKANRWLNIIVGVIYLVIWVGDLISSPGKASKILLSIADIVFLVLIIWYAYKWPK
jgi:hypothetical protein